ncbi:hypothetical protein B0T26DRAFT_99618 [Lasiosphaeria miniovina]|uniref:Uncharacterized protein n=1 Tax=Lasiosphaeria miniovina TaxID=1954250 RepID=A0AA40BJA8_9PEZI|nr:uncharacterized protein B0T26DRAFT_99618 [Lasiosphaeria miniovina]KAK0735256.1 hypothetical protein B0T26DRAFT_99618 [Lasiosphaeria miniovina]
MLAGIVLSAASNNAPLVSRCGKDLKLRRVWIDLDYPYKAPPEFERSGILITDDTVEIATRPIAASHAKLLERIFWPQPMALSFWEFGKTLVRQTASDVARYFGMDVPGSSGNYVNGPAPGGPATLPASQNAQVQKALEQLRQQATKRPEEVKNPGAMTAETSPSNTAGKVTEAGKVSGERFTGENKIRSFTDSPWEAFKKKYNQVWKPTRELPPRGCVAVSGLIELESSKAYVVIDVFGWYNPTTRKYDARSLWMSLRKMQYKKQAPLA